MNRRFNIWAFKAGLIVVLCCFTHWAAACGKERWFVKTGADQDQGAVVIHPTPATINQLSLLAAPINPNVKPNGRYSPAELTIYEITGKLTVIKAEADEDYHIVITDERGRSMIVESVAPQCSANSRFAQEIADVRAEIDGKFGPITKRRSISQLATVTGIGFFDVLHGQEGVASNGIELHPILNITFHDAKDMPTLRRNIRSQIERD